MSQFFDPTIRALNQNLNLRMENQNIVNSNIANADTPGYKAKQMEFEQAMRSALDLGNQIKLDKTSEGHLGVSAPESVQGDVFEDPNGVESLDGNTVNRSEEMMKLKENQVLYNSSIEALRKKLGMLEYGITEGGGNK